ncbi:MAG: hypothetical protein AAFY29_17725 [Pseudomonadota bacterium]
MPGTVLGLRNRFTSVVAPATLGLSMAMPADAVPAVTVVDTGQAQCCSSIAPEMPPNTYYGATIRRDDDLSVMAKPFVAEPEDPPGSVAEMERLIAEAESARGPVAAELAVPLRGLAAAHMANENYGAAVEALRRGIHVVRMNDGLNSPGQVELLEQLIGAHIRRGDYTSADAQQTYLYRILSYRRGHDAPELREATLRYADWMRGAYLGDLGRERFPRLVGLHDLYTDAIEEIEDSLGENSRELLPYLEGRAQLSYLISVYPGEQRAGVQIEARQMGDFDIAGEAQLRFWRLEQHNFRYGKQALQRRVEIYNNDPQSTPAEKAEALVDLADWFQWHRQYARAINVYEEAWAVAQDDGDARRWLEHTFVEPLELPRATVFSPGVIPLGTINNAEVAMRFDVSRHGEAKDITILSEETRETQSGITRAYHYLRNIRFRPKVSEGSVVRAEDIERSYRVRY